EAELLHVFPMLAGTLGKPRTPAPDLPDFKNRLLWTFTEVLRALCTHEPVLVVLEDLQWADASSLELLHFAARQLNYERILFVCSYTDHLRANNASLVAAEQSLGALGVASRLKVDPLSYSATAELVTRTFGTTPEVAGPFCALLYGWTRGNPFFISETLTTLVDAGRLQQREGRWDGWDVERLELPRSVRDAVGLRARALSPAARSLAQTLATLGREVTLDTLTGVAELGEAELLQKLTELRDAQLIVEQRRGDAIAYDFDHPLTRESVYSDLHETAAAALHSRIAEALEHAYGAEAEAHADELAFHYSRSHSRTLRAKALKYLIVAGRKALSRHANSEAAAYLDSALSRLDDSDLTLRSTLTEELARARQRSGDYEGATKLWLEARSHALNAGDGTRVAALERRLGLGCFWSGRPLDALAYFEAGLEHSTDPAQQVRLRIAKAMSLVELGSVDAAITEARGALALAEPLDDPPTIARAQRALLLVHAWTGAPERAREHGHRAIALLERAQDPALAYSVHWAMAVLEGLTGNSQGLVHHVAQSERIADELRSPVLRLWSAELKIEHAHGTGEWNRAIALGQHSIALARALQQRTLLPRLLVWTALVHIGRAEMEVAKAYLDEAWRVSGADRPDRRINAHSVVPVHIGLAVYHLAMGDFQEAIRIGQAGIDIVDRSGYVVWTVHRLLPTIAEAHLHLRDVPAATRIGQRLRQESEKLDHKLGLAWADACDALLVWLNGDARRSADLLRSAAERLEAIPFIPDGARVRRQLAGRLAEIGERDAALLELRRVHAVFSELHAERELEHTREMLRDLGSRPPQRVLKPGAAGLTGRELEIALLLAQNRSNKAIARSLGISTRTVTTHLTNIFKKLEVGSRHEIAQRVRHEILQ
ncbi:MAG: ATP-binding protein, partial [Longimicrobiales bacterium]